MFMNAQPRDVSHGFETFVPFSYNENRLRRGLCEMSNNEANAWSGQRSVLRGQRSYRPTSTIYGMNNDENLSSVSHGCGPELPPNQIHDHTTHYSRSLGSQIKFSRTPSITRSVPLAYAPSNAYSMYVGRLDDGPQNFDCDGLDWSASANLYTPATSAPYTYTVRTPITNKAVSCLPSPSYRMSDHSTASECFNSETNSPSTIYSCYSPIPTMAPDIIIGPFTALDVQDDSINRWWAGLAGQAGNVNALSFANDMSSDGLSKEFDSWLPDVTSAASFTQDNPYCAPLSTVSPDVLFTLRNVASQASFQYDSASIGRQPSTCGTVASTSLSSSDHGSGSCDVSRPRRKLPSQPRFHERATTQVPSKHSIDGHPQISGKAPASPLQGRSPQRFLERDIHMKHETMTRGPIISDNESLVDDMSTDMTVEESHSMRASQVVPTNRDLKDDFLVKSKLAGMSYKDIRRKGGFSEAESTLRGRFRTLTKDKQERVRRPAWGDNDVRLLKRGVRKLTHGNDVSKTKIPWKKVAEYIYRNGGSYQFGNATCRKKWDIIQDRNGN